jgi:hypothetical protein
LEFDKFRSNISVEPGSKVDVLDLSHHKWYKGEIVKRTIITHKDNHHNYDHQKASPLLYIEYKIDGRKSQGYFKADSIFLAPEGYFTADDSPPSSFEDRIMDTSFINNDSPSRILRVISRLNRILSIPQMGANHNL